jgi:predicted outer membrane repeat protein
LAIDGLGASRVFNITASSVSISGVTIKNGNASGNGGGIYASQALTLTNVSVVSNTASTSGGGVYAAGNTVLAGGRFEANRCAASYGGELYVVGNLTLSGTHIFSNTANFDGGGAFVEGAVSIAYGYVGHNRNSSLGGGLRTQSNLTLTDTRFVGNNSPLSGGGAYVLGTARLSGERFEDNHCTDIFCNGGGLSSNGLVSTGTLFLNNSAASAAVERLLSMRRQLSVDTLRTTRSAAGKAAGWLTFTEICGWIGVEVVGVDAPRGILTMTMLFAPSPYTRSHCKLPYRSRIGNSLSQSRNRQR